jgi:hypothetical protein
MSELTCDNSSAIDSSKRIPKALSQLVFPPAMIRLIDEQALVPVAGYHPVCQTTRPSCHYPLASDDPRWRRQLQIKGNLSASDTSKQLKVYAAPTGVAVSMVIGSRI